MKTECVIYCRVSSELQTAGTGLTRQMNECLAYAKARDYYVAAIFSEVGSGVDPLPVRAQAQRMAVRRNAKLVCEDYDRWSRAGAADAPPPYVEMASDIAHERDRLLRAILFPPVNTETAA